MLRIGNVLSDASINVINIHQQTGRVGINKNPTGFMFDVSGSINCDSIFVRDSIFQGGAAQWSKSSTDLYYLDGNVGIGTNDPRSALHVVGTMNANSLGVHIGQQGTNAAIELVAGDSQDAFIDFTKVSADKRGRIRYSNLDDSFRIETNNTEQICIDSGGNVGIGTTSPIYALDVDGVIRNNSSIIMTGNNLYSQSSYFNIESQHTSGYFRFRVNVGGTGGVDVMRISNNGNVGIGTTLPDYTLDVSGNMRITSNLIVEGDLSGSGANLHNIPSSSLDQNSLTINGVEVSLGGAVTLLASQWETSGNELIYNVNSSPAFKVSKDGLALPQYDVEMKGKYTAASVDPTYAWEFRNATGTAIVNDLVNGLAATPAGGATSTSEGMVFDGTDDFVSLPSLTLGGNGTLTIEAYYHKTSGKGVVIRLESPSDGQITIIDAEGDANPDTVRIYIGSNAFDTQHTGWVASGVNHIVASFDAGSVVISVNGNLNSYTGTSAYSSAVTFNTFSRIGTGNNEYSFNGTISYLRIWDGTSLSASDVAALYSRRDTLTTPQLDFHVNNQLSLAVTENGLALPQYDVEMKGKYTAASVDPTYAWEFRNATGTAIVNDLVNGLAATMYGDAYSTSEGLVLDGSGDYVDLDDFEFGNTITIELYAEVSTITTWERIFNIGNLGGNAEDLSIFRGNNTKNFYVRYARGSSSSSHISVGTTTNNITGWVHFVVVLYPTSASASILDFYVNNTKHSTSSSVIVPTITRTQTILGHRVTNLASGYSSATIAHFRVWPGTALSASDVAALYSRRDTLTTPQLDFHVNNQLSLAVTENGLALPQYDVEMKGKYTAASVEPTYAWEFRNATGTSVVYDMVNGVAADPSGAMSTSEGMVFDAGNVSITPFQFSGGDTTFETYFQTTNHLDYQMMWYFGSSSQWVTYYRGEIDYTGDLFFRTRYNNSIEDDGLISYGINSNTLYHVVYVLNTNGDRKIYLNGRLVASGNNAASIPNTFTADSTSFILGRHPYESHYSNYFHGTMAYFRIWDGTSLSASDVARLYTNRNAVGPKLDFHVNNQLSLAVTENGLALPQYDVEMKGNELACTKPTYAWEFRNATGTNTVYDLVSGVAANPNGGSSSGEGMAITAASGSGGPLANAAVTGSSITVEIFFTTSDSSTTTLQWLGSFHNYITTGGTWIGANFFVIGVTSGSIWVQQTTYSSSIGSVSSNELTHVVYTTDGTHSYIYINGNRHSTDQHIAGSVFSNFSEISIGYSPTGNNPLLGTISYFRIYDGTALSASEVEFLYNTRETKYTQNDFKLFNNPRLDFHVNNQLSLAVTNNGLALPQYDVEVKGNELACTKPTYAWEFRNNTSTNTVYDLVGGKAATPSGATSTSEGMTFSSNDDHVDAGTITLSGVAYSVEAYVNLSSTSTYDFIYDVTNNERILFLEGGDQIGVWYDAGAKQHIKSHSYAANEWIHIVSTITDSGDICIYADNAKSTSPSLGLSAIINVEFTIGNKCTRDPNDSSVFNGTIAYLRIWNGTALSASEVEFLYNTRETKYTQNDFKLFNNPRLDFHVNNQLSLAVTNNGLALPQYDVEMKGSGSANSSEQVKKIRLYRKRAAASDGYTNIREIQYWVDGVNVAGSSNVGTASTNMGLLAGYESVYPLASVNDEADPNTTNMYHSGDSVNQGGYIDITFSSSHTLAETEAVILYSRIESPSNIRLQGYVFQFLNASDEIIVETGEINPYDLGDTGSEYYVLTGPKYDSASKTSAKSNGTTAIWDGTGNTGGVVTIDLTILHRLDFHVNNQLSLAISENGLALPQYDVEVKGNELACTKPTYAWEFRNATGTATVYDLVSSFPALPQNGATSDATGMNLNPSEHVWLYNLSFGTSFSIEMYFELTNYTIEFSRLFQYAPQTGNEATSKMWITVDSNIDFGGNGVHNLSNDQAVLTSDPISSSVFIHIVVTRNHSNYSMYIDGSYKSSGTGKESALTSRSASLGSGASYGDFQGTISYFRIWNGTTLSASEVEFLYNTRETKYTQNDFKLFNHHRLDFHVNDQLSLAISENGLALPQYDVEMKGKYTAASVEPTYAWEFRNGTGTSVVYDMVNGVAAAPLGGAYSTTEGMVYDGVDDYVDLTPWYIGAESFSAEAYVIYKNARQSYARVFGFGDGQNADNIYVSAYGTSGRIRFSIRQANTPKNFTTTNTFFDINEWVHVVATLDGTTMKIYVNGDFIGSYSGHSPIGKTRNYHLLGKSNFSQNNDGWFEGTQAYFRWWQGTSLSASDVTRLYANRNIVNSSQLQIHSNNELALGITQNTLSMPRYNLVMEARSPFPGLSVGPTYAWEFRDNTGTATVYDWVSGVAVNPGGAHSTSAGMVVDSDTDYITGNAISLSNVAYSVEMYVNRTDVASGYFLFDINDTNSRMYYNTTDGDEVRIWAGGSENVITKSGYFVGSKWIHIVFTVISDGDIVVYIDNVAEYSQALGVTLPAVTDQTFVLASIKTGDIQVNTLPSTISHFRIWNGTALSASDVAILYAGRDIKGYNGYDFNVCGKSALTVAQGKADVAGALTVGGNVGLRNVAAHGSVYISLTEGTVDNGMRILNNGTNNSLDIQGLVSGTATTRMTIERSGNVGIGTNNPESALQVVGNIVGSTPTTKGVHIGMYNGLQANIELCTASTSYNSSIDFTVPNSDNKGRILYSHNENSMRFSTNSGERMRITSAGNVGIGTTSPSSSLHVAGAIDSTPDSKGIHMGILDSNHAGIEICASSTSYDSYIDFNVPTVSIKGRINYKHATNSMHFGTNGTQDRVNITSDGRVGIGTVNPSTGLDVNGNFQSQFTRIFGRSSQGYIGHRNFLDDIESMGNTGSTYQYNYAVQVASNGNHRFNASDVLFLCVQNSIKLAINSSGNVGIGTTSPRYPLEVSNYVSNRIYQGNTNVNYYTIVQSSGNALAINRDQNVTSNISALFSHGLAAHELHFFSDERIKKNIVDLSDNEALETLRLIQPKKYEYVDQFTRTNKTVYGYIAQQIKDVLPYAVSEIPNTVPNIYNIADISSAVVYTETSDISAVSTVGIHTIYVDISNVNTSAEVSMNVVMVEQSNISQNAVFSKTDLEDGSENYKLTFNDGYNTTSLHESSNILRLMDASNQEYHITIKNIETSYRVEIEEDLSGVVNAQGEVFVAGQQVPQNVYKLMFSAFDTATLDASSATLKLVDASDVTQYVNIVSVLDSSTLQIDDDLQYMVLDSSNQLFVYGQKVSKDLTSLTFDGSYNVSDISENMMSLKVLDISSQPHDVKVYSKESDANRLLLDEDIRDKIRYGVSGELFVQGQNRNITKHILNIQNYDTANLDASSTNLCIYDISNAKHEVSIVSVFDGSNIEISEDPTSFAHEGQVFVYGQKVDDFHTLSKEYINVVTLSAVQELDRALTKVTQEKNDLQTELTELKTLLQNKGII